MAGRGRGIPLTRTAAIALCIVLGAGCNDGPDPKPVERAEIGDPVPDLRLELLDPADERASIRIRDLAGQPVIVNFWASWCIPCRREFPLFKETLDRHPELQIVGVVFDDSDKAALRFSRQRDASWILVRDPRGEVARAYRVARPPGVPQTFFIDEEGLLVARVYGEIREEVLEKQIRELTRPGL